MLRDGEEVDRLTSDSHGRKHTNWNHTVNGYYNGTFGKWNIDFNADYLVEYVSDSLKCPLTKMSSPPVR